MVLNLLEHFVWLAELQYLGWINRHRHVAVDDLQFSASGLVRDCRYLRLNNLAAGSDSDTRADVVAAILTLALNSGLAMLRK
jgi:hypothetical protein